MRNILLVTALGAGLVAFAEAQTPPASPVRLSAEERAAAVTAIQEKIQRIYVFPEMRSAIVERLRQAQQSGRYDVDDPKVFAERITEDLQGVAHDWHLSLSVDPAAYAAAMAPPASDAGEVAFRRRRAIRNHHGIGEMRILPGNVRYLRITHFEWVQDETGAIYDEAMRFLRDGDVVIIDLRGNGGGTSSATHYLVSHFRDPGTVDFYSYAGSEPPRQTPALDYLPAGRLKGKPLYLLIDGGTGSGAEGVAYDLQQFKLGELVGARTAGAANNNKLLPVAPNFILSISYGRPEHVLSHTNWEGVGVQPDVPTAPAQALDVALSLALKRLAELPGASPEALAEYAWARVAVEGRLHPVRLAPGRLRALAGRYGQRGVGFGEVEVRLQDGTLVLERPDRPAARLTPLTPDGVFGIEGSDQLRARLTGSALELLWWDDPSPRVFVRH
jgi:anti-sigma28 factor (negative regulator of flagellin synthesis)